MATYIELFNLFNSSDLRNKVAVAVAICAEEILTGNDDSAPYDQTAGAHDVRVQWAGTAVANTIQVAGDVLKLVLAANNTLTTTQINNATDTAIQNNVRDVIDELATAYVANAG